MKFHLTTAQAEKVFINIFSHEKNGEKNKNKQKKNDKATHAGTITPGSSTNTQNITFSMKQNSELRLLESVEIWIVLWTRKEEISMLVLQH